MRLCRNPGELRARYPYLFAGPNIGLDFFKGWFAALAKACQGIDELIGDAVRAGQASFYFVQIKEKFGAARFYCDLHNYHLPLEAFEVKREQLRAIKSAAELSTGMACMVCGARAEIRMYGGLAACLCHVHGSLGESRELYGVAREWGNFEGFDTPADDPVLRVQLHFGGMGTAPRDHMRAHMAQQAIALLSAGWVELLHVWDDPVDASLGTGDDILGWIKAAIAEKGFEPPEMQAHHTDPQIRHRVEGRMLELQHAAKVSEEAGGASTSGS